MFGKKLPTLMDGVAGLSGGGDDRTRLAMLQVIADQAAQAGEGMGMAPPEPGAGAGMALAPQPATAPPRSNMGPFSDENGFPAMAPVGVRPDGFGVPPTTSGTPAQPPTMPAGLFGNRGSSVVSAGAEPHKKVGFFAKDGPWRDTLGLLGAYLSASSGNPGGQMMLQGYLGQQADKRRAAAQQAERQQEWARADALRLDERQYKASQPDYFSSGNDRVRWDPTTGKAEVVYDGPSDAQDYATQAGYTPGTPEYASAMQDYVLRGYGPTALNGKTTLEGVRQDNRLGMEDLRQRHRVDLRGVPSYSALHPRPRAGGSGAGGGGSPRTTGNVFAPILAKVAQGGKLNAGEQEIYDTYRHRRTGGAGGGSTPSSGGGKVYQDASGKRIKYDPVSKTWVDAR
jgi:hypothetical protein